jgi:hypothetical protein
MNSLELVVDHTGSRQRGYNQNPGKERRDSVSRFGELKQPQL